MPIICEWYIKTNSFCSDFLLGRYFGMVASWHWKDIVETIKKHYPEYSVPPSRVPSRMSDGAGSQGDAAEVSTFLCSVAILPKFEFLRNGQV